MSRSQEVLTAVGAFACAVGIGFFMQNSKAGQYRYGQPTPVQAEMGLTPLGASTVGLSSLSFDFVQLTSAEAHGFKDVSMSDVPVPTSMAPRSSLQSPMAQSAGSGCAISVHASPSAAAMVNLSIEAPCLPNERVSIMHSGVTVSYLMTPTGHLNVAIPALTEDAVFDFMFSGGLSARATAQIDTINLYDRAVVQWSGDDAVQLHAREFGALYGETGHIWAGAARDLDAIEAGTGGFLTRHGHSDLPVSRQIEVYTFPTAATRTGGDVALTLEVEVTDATCGQDLEAKTLQRRAGGDVVTYDFILTVPGCEAEGDFLVLNNLFQDLKVAQR